jgi:urease accessory protein
MQQQASRETLSARTQHRPSDGGGAAGKLELSFDCDPDGRTFLGRQYTTYPFHICRPHRFPHDPAGMTTLYVQSSSGGIYEQDRLETSLRAGENAQVHLTTQASTIVHGMREAHAEQDVTIDAACGSLVEYLPDPLILFPRSRIKARLKVRAARTARVLLCDSFIHHDPAGEARPFDWLDNEAVIENAERMALVRDSFRIHGDELAANLPGINGPYTAQGTFLIYAPLADHERLLTELRGELDANQNGYAGASLLPHDCGVWVRCLAKDAHSLRSALNSAWVCARKILVGGDRPLVRRK